MLFAADVKLLFDERRVINHGKKTPGAMSTGVHISRHISTLKSIAKYGSVRWPTVIGGLLIVGGLAAAVGDAHQRQVQGTRVVPDS